MPKAVHLVFPRNVSPAKKSGPVTGATIKRQGREGKSGKAMQGLIPKIGTIKREKSNALEED
jgi:hypothetical protein